MIGALNLKLLRDTWNIKGQMVAISLVMSAGIAVFIIMFGALDSLKLTRDTYYDHYQFADVFASLKRAPQSVVKRIQEIPGVARVQHRVVFGITLQMPGLNEPATGKLISYPDSGEPKLNKVYLRSGRYLYPNEENSVLVDESFYIAHQLTLGDKVSVIMNGFKRQLKVVGVVLSPEYIYSIAPGALMPDGKRYGIFFMGRRSLEAAVNMKGAFNDLTLKLERNAKQETVKERVDQILKPYGGLIAIGRDEQVSNFFVENEFKQLVSLGWLAPIIFLSVAAFLVNVVMSRQIATQREQIGMLKAVGYSDLDISLHFLKMVLVITACGGVVGIILGIWMGVGMTELYAKFFHFPILKFSFSAEVMIFAVFACAVSAVIGTLIAIRNAANLPPAEAMRPASPPVYKKTFLEKLGLHRHLSFLSRIVLRQLERRPFRSMLSAVGMSMASAILVFSLFLEDSMTHLVNVQYELTQREDLNLTFVEPRPKRALEEIRSLSGVLKAEGFRDVPANLVFKHYQKRGAITGLERAPDLRRIIDENLAAVTLPERGLVLSAKLAEILHISVGEQLTVEVLEARRPTLKIPVVAITQEYIGTGAYININSLNQLLDEGPKISGVSVQIDDNYSAVLFNQLKQIPQIVGLNIVSVLRRIFDEIMAENLLKMVTTNIFFASIISFGVIYNTARIALSERARELASLRVLGLTRKEVAYILFGELGFIALISLPIGLWFGFNLSKAMSNAMETELFRIPLYINNSTYGYSVLVVLISALISFYLVWRQVEGIDLVSAQKGVE